MADLQTMYHVSDHPVTTVQPGQGVWANIDAAARWMANRESIAAKPMMLHEVQVDPSQLEEDGQYPGTGYIVKAPMKAQRVANILDPISDCLDPTVFEAACEDNPRLRDVHRKFVQGTVYRILEAHGIQGPADAVELVLTGSLTTYQYSTDSDVDISLFFDEELSPAERAAVISWMVNEVDGTIMPGTTHPLQCFVVPSDIKKEDLYQPGLRSGYDIDTNAWIVPPDKDRVHDVEKDEHAAYIASLFTADKMDRLLINQPEAAVRYWHRIHKDRQQAMRAGKGDFALENVRYKMLANRNFFPRLEQATGEHIAKKASPLMNKMVRKFVYDGDTNKLIVGEHAPEEGATWNHNELAKHIGADLDQGNALAGTIGGNAGTYAQYEAGGRGAKPVTYEQGNAALHQAVPELDGILGYSMLPNSPWTDTAEVVKPQPLPENLQMDWDGLKTSSVIPNPDELAPYRDNQECYLSAEGVANQWPHLQQDAGFYVHPTHGPGDHAWNVAPNGVIVDTTASQHPGPEIVSPDHPHYPRYVSWVANEQQAQQIAHDRGEHYDGPELNPACPMCKSSSHYGEDDWDPEWGKEDEGTPEGGLTPEMMRQHFEETNRGVNPWFDKGDKTHDMLCPQCSGKGETVVGNEYRTCRMCLGEGKIEAPYNPEDRFADKLPEEPNQWTLDDWSKHLPGQYTQTGMPLDWRGLDWTLDPNELSDLGPTHQGKVAHEASEPPNLRKGNDKQRCELCTMFDKDKGTCWGYANKKVSKNELCDSFSQDQRVKNRKAAPEWQGGLTPELVDAILRENPQKPGEPDFQWLSRCAARLRDHPELQHEFLFETREMYDPVDFVAEGASRYRAMKGLPDPQVDIQDQMAPYHKAFRVAQAYDLTPDQSHDPRVQEVFNDFKRQNEEMHNYITAPAPIGLGINVNVVDASDGEPYSSAEEQAEDVRRNHNFSIQTGLGGDHPLLSTPEYDRFRTVHDIFGHVGVGGGFDRHGEWQAWLAHMSMYQPPGADAMASEYHGVNSSLWAGQNTGTGKALLLPEDLISNPWDGQGNLDLPEDWLKSSSKRGIIAAMKISPIRALLISKGMNPKGVKIENLHKKQHRNYYPKSKRG